MYYKIENKECEVYKKLHELRTYEIKIQNENLDAVKNKVGLAFEDYLGSFGQMNLFRVTQFTGFRFIETEKVDLKTWKRHEKYASIFIPNKKTKKGREMQSFLDNLKDSSIFKVFNILDIDYNGKFKLPFVEIVEDLILLYLDDAFEYAPNENVIEITKTEFNKIREVDL